MNLPDHPAPKSSHSPSKAMDKFDVVLDTLTDSLQPITSGMVVASALSKLMSDLKRFTFRDDFCLSYHPHPPSFHGIGSLSGETALKIQGKVYLA